MNNRRLYLDDVRIPLDDSWYVVKNFDEFVKYIQEYGMPYEISFDHDLEDFIEDEERTGMTCAKWLVDNDLVPDKFYVHSANYAGSQNILGLLNNWQLENGMIPNGYRTFWECRIEEDEL
jgi:hypothetical protein